MAGNIINNTCKLLVKSNIEAFCCNIILRSKSPYMNIPRIFRLRHSKHYIAKSPPPNPDPVDPYTCLLVILGSIRMFQQTANISLWRLKNSQRNNIRIVICYMRRSKVTSIGFVRTAQTSEVVVIMWVVITMDWNRSRIRHDAPYDGWSICLNFCFILRLALSRSWQRPLCILMHCRAARNTPNSKEQESNCLRDATFAKIGCCCNVWGLQRRGSHREA